MPYISAAIIMQLLTHVEPRLKELRKEGEAGRRKITRYTRYGTVALASFQALGVSIALEGQQAGALPVVIDPGIGFRITTVATLVTGTVFLMWLGEQISERGVGNGISIIIFAGIVAGLPTAIGGTLELARTGELHVLLVLVILVLALSVTAFVVFVDVARRLITGTDTGNEGAGLLEIVRRLLRIENQRRVEKAEEDDGAGVKHDVQRLSR